MSVYWNDRTNNLSPYIPGEQPRDRRFIKLNTNENPYPPAPAVIEAIQRAVGDRLRLYPDPACTEFKEAAAAYYGVRPEQVFAGNGSDEVLAFAFGAFFETRAGIKSPPPVTPAGPHSGRGINSEPGCETAVLFPDITYSFYPVYADLWGIPFRVIPLDNNFSIQTADYKIPSGGVVFANPNAPTGKVLPLADIFMLAKYLETQGRVFILDEAYAAFGADSAVPYITEYPNLLTVHTLSKSASLAGLRVGFAIGNEELIEGLCRVRDSFNSYTMDRLALAGAAAAVSSAAYYDGINRKVMATREWVSKELRELGFDLQPSAANFIFMKAPAKGGAAFFAALRERGILVRHFNKDRIADYLRVSIGTDDEMDLFLSACKGIIGKWGDSKI
ncbi:MAG: aminotransferase class I/II-fold pyridoxal phosphate-dependent enzyme [Treponema sp.]|jgi:histidinol-phosphate aminotransferase|nr:aminotransferase class I/II-fold pyridoxal phosphate-dependent enzyme [Treponema sp.]